MYLTTFYCYYEKLNFVIHFVLQSVNLTLHHYAFYISIFFLFFYKPTFMYCSKKDLLTFLYSTIDIKKRISLWYDEDFLKCSRHLLCKLICMACSAITNHHIHINMGLSLHDNNFVCICIMYFEEHRKFNYNSQFIFYSISWKWYERSRSPRIFFSWKFDATVYFGSPTWLGSQTKNQFF